MAVERFFIIKNGRREGPFDEAYIRFLLESDEIGFDDFCETVDGERLTLGDLYEPVQEDGESEEEEVEDVVGRSARTPREGRKRPRPRLLYVGHPSFLTYTLAWLLVGVGAIGGFMIGPQSLWGMLAGFGIASLAIIYIVLARAARVYVITARRIEAVSGLVAKDSTEIRVEDIRTINVRRSGLAGLLGVGTVDFSSTGDAIDVSFADVWGARRIKKLVRRLQDELEE